MANPNPSPATRFTSSGNPAGKTSKQRREEVQAAEIATSLTLAALIRMQENVQSGETSALDLVTADNLRLFKDVQDRAHGTPKQSVQHGGDPENPLPTLIRIEAASVNSDDSVTS